MARTRKSVYKVLWSVVLVLILSFTSIQNVMASGKSESIDEFLLHVATNWKETQYPEDVEISDYIPIYSDSHELSGYQVSYSRNGQPAGYIILSNVDRRH